MLHQSYKQKSIYFRVRALAREMRKNKTAAEEFFWAKVRDRKFFGLKWNRQFILSCVLDGNFKKFYIPDFHCHSLMLIVELDGQIHLKQQSQDLIRTEDLNMIGFTVLRFTNEQVLNHWDEVATSIWEFMQNYRGKES